MKASKISVTDLILFAIEKSVEAGELFFESMNDLRTWIYEVYGNYPRQKLDPRVLSQAIRRLRMRGLIERENKHAEQVIIRLTQKGKDYLLVGKDDSRVEWDGRWRIVIFDIPESKRLVRNVLRRRLRSWGFIPWQKSVWASKKNVTEHLRSLIDDLGIDNWVLVIESDNIGR